MHDSQPLYLAISIAILVISLFLAKAIKSYIQTIYPFKEIPWASSNQRGALTNELMLLILAIPLSLPTGHTLAPWFFGAACLLCTLLTL